MQPKTTDQREIEAALSEIHLALEVERLRIASRIAELEAILDRIHQRIKGRTQ